MARVKRSEKPWCAWTRDIDPDFESWDTSCGEKFQFTEGGPRENKMRFCCYCGALLRTYDSK